ELAEGSCFFRLYQSDKPDSRCVRTGAAEDYIVRRVISKSWQNKLHSLLEGERVKVDQMKREYDFTIKGAKVFASTNDLNKLSAPLQSCFRRLHLPKYSREQFLQIAVKVCPKLSEETAPIIAEAAWRHQRCDKPVQVGKETRWPR